MTASQPAAAGGKDVARQRRFGPLLTAFVFGLPLAAGIFYLVNHGPLQGTIAQHYVRYPAEYALVVLFSGALGAFLGKIIGVGLEAAAARRRFLPPWDGKTVPVAEAGKLLAGLAELPGWVRASYLGNRVAAVLHFLVGRRSANELDDQLRTLADNDAVALEHSYSLTRFITWATPILGFIGTVLGITAAIAGVAPDKLEESLGQVTDGLAEAFDATALALCLTMVAMFISFVVERLEQKMLNRVDRFVEDELAHRFERTGAVGGELVEVLRHQGDGLLRTTELLVERQAAVWARAFEESNQRRAAVEADFKKQLAAAMEAALERTLAAHAKRLSELQQQAAAPANAIVEKLGALGKTADTLARQAELLAKLQDGERQLVQLQQLLQQNLATLADAGAFQQAVHSLTAAIHLLTAQAASSSRRPGVAA